MERPIEHELDELKKLLLTMGGEVERQLDRAVRSVVDRNSELANEVIAGDARIDRQEIEVDRLVREIIVRQRPLAGDLRLVMTANRIAPDLERVADHAVNIAEQALRLNKLPPLKRFVTLPQMAATASAMVTDALGAFIRGDSRLAREVIRRDDDVDAMHEEIFRELLTYMMEDPRTIQRSVSILLIARSLERIADQGTNICEQVVFLVDGEDIRHPQSEGGA